MSTGLEMSCFVIGPIGDKLAEYGTREKQIYDYSIQVFEKIIMQACSVFKLDPLRADMISKAGDINDQICHHLKIADVVIADLTHGNPNVMYELGMRHTLGKLTIQIGEKEKLPFDLTTIRTIQFIRSESGFIDARDELISILKTGLSGDFDPVTSTRIWLSDLKEEDSGAGLDTKEDTDDDAGFLEKLADAEENFENLPMLVVSITKKLEEFTEITRIAKEKTDRVNRSGGKASAKLAIANEAAYLLETTHSDYSGLISDLIRCVNLIEPGINEILNMIESDPEQLPEAVEFLKSFIQTGESCKAVSDMFIGFNQSLAAVGKLSRKLKSATSQIRHSNNILNGNLEVFIEFQIRINRFLT